MLFNVSLLQSAIEAHWFNLATSESLLDSKNVAVSHSGVAAALACTPEESKK